MDPIEYSLPPKIMMEQVEGKFSKSKKHIEKLDHLHEGEIKEWIESPMNSQMRINLFLREWEKVKKREIKSLICKDQLQLEYAQCQDIADLLDVFSKWQSSLGKY